MTNSARRVMIAVICFFLVVLVTSCQKQINVKSGTEKYCKTCNQLIASDVKNVTVPENEASAYKVTRSEIKMCDACKTKLQQEKQAKLERQRRMIPILVGLSRKAIVDQLGTPNRSRSDLAQLSWEYDNKPEGFKTRMQFERWTSHQEVDDRGVTILTIYQTPQMVLFRPNTEQSSKVIDFLPSEIIDKTPKGYFTTSPSDANTLCVFWAINNKMYLLFVKEPSGQPLYSQSDHADLQSGQVSHSYKRTNVDWRQCNITSFEQYGFVYLKTSEPGNTDNLMGYSYNKVLP